ncbi:ATP-dependent helicase [Halalkalicoccus salilacus]|uniref:ATP-dependent helicase n=1 Tax=Halalkalicoccus salilacus TaxID=3117459 RepID=UPI00300F70D4
MSDPDTQQDQAGPSTHRGDGQSVSQGGQTTLPGTNEPPADDGSDDTTTTALSIESGTRDDGAAYVVRAIGAPGSGKSTLLRAFIRREREEFGTPIGDMLVSTFTRAAREDMITALIEETPNADEDDLRERVRTLHSAALNTCRESGVIHLRDRNDPEGPGIKLIRRRNSDDEALFEWFFRTEFPSVRYDPHGADPIRALETGESMGTLPGNDVMSVYDYLRSKDWPLEWYYRAPIDVDLPDPTTIDILRAWDAYKERHDLMQDNDYVQRAIDTNALPNARVLFIDEFQDLSPLQQTLYEQWRDSGTVDRIYIAGDFHQAIYGFRGAEPSYFRDTRADRTIHRETSWRCRQAIIGGSRPIAAAIPDHDVSRVKSHRDGGRYEHVSVDGPDELGTTVTRLIQDHGEVFLLARTNRQVGKLAYGLREAGIPYYDIKGDSGAFCQWRDPLPALLAALQAFDRGDPFPLVNAERLLTNVTGAARRQDAMTDAENRDLTGDRQREWIDPGQYRGWFPHGTRARDILPLLTVDDRDVDLLADTLVSGATHDPTDVRIGTIHAAKGLGAPAVVVFPAYSQKQLARYHDDSRTAAEEHRLYYVAMTRAADRLLIGHDYFRGDEFPPLAR